MLIETDDWVKLSDAARESGVQQSVAYRIAHRIGIVEVIFGAYVVRKADIPKIAAAKLEPGWRWKTTPMEAVRDSKKATLAKRRKATRLKKLLKKLYPDHHAGSGTSGTTAAGPRAG